MKKLFSTSKNLLPKNAFARGVSVLVGGAIGAQALMILAAPLLTRLYTPESFGLLGVYAALLAIWGVISSLRYEIAIPLPDSDIDAANLLILSLISVIATTAITSLMVALMGVRFVELLNVPELGGYLWLLPVGGFLAGTYKVLSYWAIRTKSFSAISKTRITQVLTTLSVQILGSKFGGVGLLLGQAGGQGAGSLSLANSSFKLKKPVGWSWSGIVEVAYRYKQFPIFSTWSGLFNAGGTQLPPLLFAGLFGAGPAGLYALAHRVLAMPMSVIGDAVGKVFFSGAAEALREDKLDQMVFNGFSSLVKIAFPAALLFMLVAPQLFSVVFGENWKIAGEMARWMIPWLLVQFISSPLSTIYFVLEKENYNLIFQVFLLVSRVLSLIVGSLYLDFVGTVIIFSLTSAACYSIYVVTILFISHVRVLDVFSLMVREVFLLASLSLPTTGLYFLWGWGVSIIFQSIAFFILYFIRAKSLYRA